MGLENEITVIYVGYSFFPLFSREFCRVKKWSAAFWVKSCPMTSWKILSISQMSFVRELDSLAQIFVTQYHFSSKNSPLYAQGAAWLAVARPLRKKPQITERKRSILTGFFTNNTLPKWFVSPKIIQTIAIPGLTSLSRYLPIAHVNGNNGPVYSVLPPGFKTHWWWGTLHLGCCVPFLTWSLNVNDEGKKSFFIRKEKKRNLLEFMSEGIGTNLVGKWIHQDHMPIGSIEELE